MKQPIEDYFNVFLCELNLQHYSLTNFIDFVIINELRFLDISELNALIEYFAEDNHKDKVADLVFENYLYGDVQNRFEQINFHLLFDELKDILEIKDKFIDEIECSSEPVKVFIKKDSECLLDIFYYSPI